MLTKENGLAEAVQKREVVLRRGLEWMKRTPRI